MEIYPRHLSAIERLFWLIDQVEPIHFCVAAQVEGSTTLDGWKAAFSALRQRHPLLASSIQKDSTGAPYFHHEPENHIPLRIVEGNVLARMDSEIAHEMNTPFREPNAFLIRATVLHEAQRSVVILTVHHSIADAISLTYAIRDLLQSLAGKTLQPLPTPPSHEHLLGIPDTRAQGDMDTSWTISPLNPEFAQNSAQITSFRFTPAVTSYLRERARQEKTTIHGALSAALTLAVKKLRPEGNPISLRTNFPISTRKMLGQDEECVLLTTRALIDLEYPDGAEFWDVARKAKDALTPFLKMDFIVAERKELHKMLAPVNTPEQAAQVAQNLSKLDFTLSNMGNLTLETHYGDLKLEAMWGPSILLGSSKNQHEIGVATVNNNLTLIYASNAPLPHLLETISNTVVEVCAEYMPV